MKGFLFTAAVLLWFVPSVNAETIFFLVAELPGEEIHNDSYVVPLNDPADISHARRLIDEGPGIGQLIVHAGIAPGPDGINRDHLAPGKPEWSWHISEFIGFTARISVSISWNFFPGWLLWGTATDRVCGLRS